MLLTLAQGLFCSVVIKFEIAAKKYGTSGFGARTFISEDLAVMISVFSAASLLKYIWHPSVFSTDIVGTIPIV